MKRLVIAVVIALTGCSHLAIGQTNSEEAMMTMAAALTKVSASTEANLLYGSPTEALSDEEFLTQSVAHDPGLLTPFSGYRIAAKRTNGHTVILVCTKEGEEALLEDVGCTAAMDRHAWKDNNKSRCEFVLDVSSFCSATLTK
jgi:hypothetical protein